jgi:two-component system cell cycle response regulator
VPARILVVDDVLINVKLMQAKLTAEYFDVMVAYGGQEAIEVARHELPDIILLDVMMPVIDGYQVCRTLKDDSRTAHIPIIMVTALDQPFDRVNGLECGADDFVTKPVQDAILMARIRSLVRLKTVTDELRMREATNNSLGADGRSPTVQLKVQPKGADIVLVEDKDRSAAHIADALAEMGKVTVISNCADVVETLRRTPCEVLIVSLSLSDADGLRICSHIRAAETTRALPILAIVEDGDNERLIRALDIGVNDAICRPLESQEIVARVRTQVRRGRYERSLRELLHTNLRMAVTDSLTGLYNRHYMQTHLERLAAEAGAKRRLSVLMLDIDYFKPVNDKFGHAAGDAVLVEVARCVQQNVRGVDLAARYGGEEFVILMPDTERELATHAAERLRKAISEISVEIGMEAPLRVTVSIGVATSEDKLDNAAELVDQADAALYEAKKEGRNRVVTAKGVRFSIFPDRESRASNVS